MTDHTLFEQKAPPIMRLLCDDFPITVDDSAAMLGNFGHETAGFTLMQELKPTVPGSAGGFGWAQWTASRRRAFEAYCERNGLDPLSDKANYGWLFVELKGPEARAIAALQRAGSLDQKTVAFERAFERAGVKHDDSRQRWARIALAAYRDAEARGGVPLPDFVEAREPPPPAPDEPQRPPPPPPELGQDEALGRAVRHLLDALFAAAAALRDRPDKPDQED